MLVASKIFDNWCHLSFYTRKMGSFSGICGEYRMVTLIYAVVCFHYSICHRFYMWVKRWYHFYVVRVKWITQAIDIEVLPEYYRAFVTRFCQLHLYEVNNSLRPSDAYMRRKPRPSLIQMMACRLFGAKPLSEPMLHCCKFDIKEQTSVTF